MKILNKVIPSLVLVSSLVKADTIAIDSIGVNLGISNIATQQTDVVGSITLNTSQKESYTNSELYMLVNGSEEDKSVKMSLNYINNSNSEFKNNILMIGINRYYQIDNYNIYTGFLVGLGHLEWQKNPIQNTTNKNLTAGSIVGALQLGAEYKLDTNIVLGLNTKYYRSNYTTKLDIGTNESEVTHKNSYSLAFGVRYFF